MTGRAAPVAKPQNEAFEDNESDGRFSVVLFFFINFVVGRGAAAALHINGPPALFLCYYYCFHFENTHVYVGEPNVTQFEAMTVGAGVSQQSVKLAPGFEALRTQLALRDIWRDEAEEQVHACTHNSPHGTACPPARHDTALLKT